MEILRRKLEHTTSKILDRVAGLVNPDPATEYRPIKSLEIHAEQKALFPLVNWGEVEGSRVEFSYPDREAPVLRWTDFKGRDCYAHPASSATSKPQELREKLEFYQELYPDREYICGPAIGIVGTWVGGRLGHPIKKFESAPTLAKVWMVGRVDPR